MKLNKQDILKALETISAPGEGQNMVESKAVTNVITFGDEVVVDITITNPSLQAKKKTEVEIMKVIHDLIYEKAKIYATDLNAKMIDQAKKGTFSLSNMQLYTKNYIEAGGTSDFSEYYKVVGEKVVFNPFLQKNMIYAEHNLVTDSSFNEFDIIICRNVLIYFNKSLQNEVHQLFYESLSLGGFLGLGKREGVRFTSHGNCYGEIDATEKLYRKFI